MMWNAVAPGATPGAETSEAYLALRRAENRHPTIRVVRRAWSRAYDRWFQLRHADPARPRLHMHAQANESRG
jgi:hypothetical protein